MCVADAETGAERETKLLPDFSGVKIDAVKAGLIGGCVAQTLQQVL